jgi:CubicO group peptidase (beta-lactamase class C family)
LAIALATFVLHATTTRARACTGTTGTPEERIDAIFAPWSHPDAPGAAVAVVQGGKLIFARGYGCADLEHHVPITTSTVFELGSMSKQFTAMAVVLLAQAGALGYDDDVRKYMPELPDYGVVITLRHLLWHTSGLREQWFLAELAGWHFQDVWTKDDMLRIVARQRSLDSKPGAEHAYRNTNYFLLALVVERVSGERFSEFCRKNLFVPLGMDRTLVRDDHTQLIADRAHSYHRDPKGGFTLSESNVESFGDTNAWSTVEDLAKWQCEFTAAHVAGKEGIAAMLTPGRTSSGGSFPYGFGLRVGTDRGMSAVWHGGAAYGWRTEAIRYPEHDLSAIVLCNSSDMDMSDLVRKVADVFLPEGSAKSTPQSGVRLAPPSEAGRKLEDLGEVAGLYFASAIESLVRIESRDTGLLATITDGSQHPLVRMRANRFRIGAEAPRGMVEFESAAVGQPWTMRAWVGEDPRPYERVEPSKTDRATLEAYAGKYTSDEVRATFELVATANGLVLRRDRFDDAPLAPWFADAFRNDWLGVLRITRDAKGAINGFTVWNRVRGVQGLAFARQL